jgi:glycosyltransferase involved in cell wall biosynthesis
MRILHIITTVDRGGAETQLLMLASVQQLIGNKVSVLYLKGGGELKEEFENSGINVIDEFAEKSFIIQCRKIQTWISEQNFEILHAHLQRAEIVCRLVKGKIPYVVTRHNSETFVPKYPGLTSQVLSKFALGQARACISISNSVEKFLNMNKEIPRHLKSVVVHYGIDVQKRDNIKRLPSPKVKRILCVSRLVPQKDLATLLNGFSKFREVSPDTRLTIVGKGISEKKLKKLASLLDLDDNVDWISQSSDIPLLMENHDCLILSSNYEGFGLVLLEAMNSRLPIIASRIPTSEEILGSNYIGFFDVGNAESLFNKMLEFDCIDKRIISIDMQNQILENFSIRKTVETTLSVYRSALQ